ncbi:MAG: hypothetical protein KatS3mg115_2326 [Candidatus Poribacteria bacterium]|nr:MAG: hypothetical protein KatS3mg115_2326 [Candidatus Poribacteria bacterium]
MPLTVIRMARPSPTWQESYVRVKPGQRLVVDAEGAWSPDLRNRIGWCGGDGVPNLPAGEGYLLPGANVGALIGRIGNGEPICFGARYDNVVDQEGVIFLAMNDHPNHNNQAGYLMVQLIVFDPDEE